MSLTSYLTDPEHSEIKKKFREEFIRPAFGFKNSIKAPPLTANYGIVGAAFDYILRFAIQYHNKEELIHGRTWTSDSSFGELVDTFKGDKQITLRNKFDNAKSNYAKFLQTGKITNELLANTLFLAKLDLYFRSGIIASDLFTENDLDIKDLRTLYSVLNISDFKFKKECFINPVFGRGSLMVGGADADIIIDHTLIEIKVTKHLKLEREYLNQLIGYYILSLIGGINNRSKTSKIKKIGIYFARHGFLWTVPLAEIGTPEKFESVKNWFISYFDNLRVN